MNKFTYESKDHTLGREAELLQIAWERMGEWERTELVQSLQINEPDFIGLIVSKELFLREQDRIDN